MGDTPHAINYLSWWIPEGLHKPLAPAVLQAYMDDLMDPMIMGTARDLFLNILLFLSVQSSQIVNSSMDLMPFLLLTSARLKILLQAAIAVVSPPSP